MFLTKKWHHTVSVFFIELNDLSESFDARIRAREVFIQIRLELIIQDFHFGLAKLFEVPNVGWVNDHCPLLPHRIKARFKNLDDAFVSPYHLSCNPNPRALKAILIKELSIIFKPPILA